MNNSKEQEYKTISITPKVKKKLGKFGRKNETWSQIILRLLMNRKSENKVDKIGE